MSNRFDRLKVHYVDEILVLSILERHAWDGSDLSLLRDTLIDFVENEERGAIGISLKGITYIPTGFFGMLYDFHEKGFSVYLFNPSEKIRNMLWFQHFFEGDHPESYQLCIREPRSFKEKDFIPATTVE